MFQLERSVPRAPDHLVLRGCLQAFVLEHVILLVCLRAFVLEPAVLRGCVFTLEGHL